MMSDLSKNRNEVFVPGSARKEHDRLDDRNDAADMPVSLGTNVRKTIDITLYVKLLSNMGGGFVYPSLEARGGEDLFVFLLCRFAGKKPRRLPENMKRKTAGKRRTKDNLKTWNRRSAENGERKTT